MCVARPLSFFAPAFSKTIKLLVILIARTKRLKLLTIGLIISNPSADCQFAYIKDQPQRGCEVMGVPIEGA